MTRTGRLYSDDPPELTPHRRPAENVPVVKHARMRPVPGQPEQLPKAVWSDSQLHLGDDPWPAHAVPLFIFPGRDRPRPAYREEVRFTLRDEKYITFGLRLRCGTGDRYMGGSVGLVHSPDRTEALPGARGQLVTIIDLLVQPDNSIIVCAIGDLDFTVTRAWMPRGLRGLQLAFVQVDAIAPRLESILETLVAERSLAAFGRLLRLAAPDLERKLSSGLHTVFCPTTAALRWLDDFSDEELSQRPDLEALARCHVCSGKIPCEALYSGRILTALDGTLLTVTFAVWPKGGPSVNEVPIEHMDLMCSNGIIHTITGLLRPAPAPHRRSAH